MNDSEVDPVVPKKQDEKYYFFVEKSQFQNCKNAIFSRFVPKSMDCGSKPHSQAHLQKFVQPFFYHTFWTKNSRPKCSDNCFGLFFAGKTQRGRSDPSRTSKNFKISRKPAKLWTNQYHHQTYSYEKAPPFLKIGQ